MNETKGDKLTTVNQKGLFSFLSFLLLGLWGEPLVAKELIPIGIVLDLNSSVGSLAESYISMAHSDFYTLNAHYQTRLSLVMRNSENDAVTAASAALDLIKNEEVRAIIGPQKSGQAKFVVEIGRKAQVPIISFSATSPSLSPTRHQFFIRTAQDDFSQVKAIAAIIQAYGWREVIPIYEDTEYGNGLIPYITDALHEIGTRVPYRSVIAPSSGDTEIQEELPKLRDLQTKIFLVHMTADLGSKLFFQAKNAGMMNEGYAWIVTEGLSALLNPKGPNIMDFMQGVLGVRPLVPKSKGLEDFKRRWKRNVSLSKPNRKIKSTAINLLGLWAYDTVYALAMAVEKAGIVNSTFSKKSVTNSKVDLADIGIYEAGPRLLNTILGTEFQGLSGDFRLVNRQLEPSALEIFNVFGNRERIIGYWSQQKGLLKNLRDTGDAGNSISKEILKQPIWPGDTIEQPKKLRIGVPVRQGFYEFMKVEMQSPNSKPKVSGFSHDVFLAVVDSLPFSLPYKFIPFAKENGDSAGTYDELLYQINLKKFDAVVGDTTIVANRSNYVDFTLPYSESGVSMIVLMKHDKRENIWIFLKPLSLDLWLTTCAAFIFTGSIIWVLEHRTNTDFRGPPNQQLGTIFWFSFSTLVFAHKEKVVNNGARFVLIIWIFVVLILTQSYTASLASLLTVNRLQPAIVDLTEIKRNGYFVGYEKNSFVRGLLVEHLKFDESKLKPYNTIEDYHEALTNGSNNGGVAAIFSEIPYIKVFLAKYCSQYAIVGPTYRTDGFGFAFPLKSPLVSYFSRAILNVTEDREKFERIQAKYFSSRTTCQDQNASITSDSPSLSVKSFGGLFIITGITSLISLLFYVFKFLHFQWPALRTIPLRSEILLVENDRNGQAFRSKRQLLTTFGQK
ncbi:Glutamate receptor [Quillaja saponaria]|uniref:Glutamate receptor n=1 Tax=Quillaja saponaria TaxID=32244 RepID=A0AAD7PHX9_QUISA|nr:Glutamate receptor [Quillaja saponaria]